MEAKVGFLYDLMSGKWITWIKNRLPDKKCKQRKEVMINQAFCDLQHNTVFRNVSTIYKIATVGFNVLAQLYNSTGCIPKNVFEKEKETSCFVLSFDAYLMFYCKFKYVFSFSDSELGDFWLAKCAILLLLVVLLL